MADLVGDHVRPGEIPRRVQLAAHVLVEAQIEVDAPVGWAVERADGGGRRPAAVGAHRVRVQVELRVLVALPVLAEYGGPRVLDVVEDVGGEVLEITLWILLRRDADGIRRTRRLGSAQYGADVEAALSATAAEDRDRDDHKHDDEARAAAEPGDVARNRHSAASSSAGR